ARAADEHLALPAEQRGPDLVVGGRVGVPWLVDDRRRVDGNVPLVGLLVFDAAWFVAHAEMVRRSGTGRRARRAGRRPGAEAFAEEVAVVPAWRLVRRAHEVADARVQAREARGVHVLDRLVHGVAGLVVAVAQERAQRQRRGGGRVGRLAGAGGGGEHAAVEVDRGDAGADERVLVAAH